MKRLLFLLLVMSLCSCSSRYKERAQKHLDLEGRRYEVVSVGPVKRINTCAWELSRVEAAASHTASWDEFKAYYEYGETEEYFNSLFQFVLDPVQFNTSWDGITIMEGFDAICRDSHGEEYPTVFGLKDGVVVYCSFETQEQFDKLFTDVFR